MEQGLVRRLGVDEYANLVSLIFTSTIPDLVTIESDPAEMAIRRTAAGLMLKAHETRCGLTLEMLLTRVLGRARDVTPNLDDKSRNGHAILEEIRKVIDDPRNGRA